jgi:hypothetical protein
MRKIVVVDGAFALLMDDRVIGVVERTEPTSWGFFPTVPAKAPGAELRYVPLHDALDAAHKFEPSLPLT